MKGYKTCENCHSRNSARNTKCNCGHVFLATVKVLDYTKSSPGKKKCKCGAYIGVRSEYCPVCKNKFEKKVEEAKKVDVPNKYKGGKIIYCPAGSCPVKLKNIDKQEVFDWCDAIYSYFSDTYTEDAMIYWLRFYYKINSYEYNTAKQWIKEWASPSQNTLKESLSLDVAPVIYAGKNSQSQARYIHKPIRE